MSKPTPEQNRDAQRRWRERLKADPERWEAFKKQERRRITLRYHQNPEYAEQKKAALRQRYAIDPKVREDSAMRNRTPAELARRRALACLSRGLNKHLELQVEIMKQRADRLRKQIDELLS